MVKYIATMFDDGFPPPTPMRSKHHKSFIKVDVKE